MPISRRVESSANRAKASDLRLIFYEVPTLGAIAIGERLETCPKSEPFALKQFQRD